MQVSDPGSRSLRIKAYTGVQCHYATLMTLPLIEIHKKTPPLTAVMPNFEIIIDQQKSIFTYYYLLQTF